MGATLGKSKSLSITDQINGHEKEVMITNSNNHIDQTTTTTTLEKKPKKKKEKLSIKKSLNLKVDKYTNTDGDITSSSSSTSCIKQLVNGTGYNNNISSDALYIRSNSNNPSETPSKDILEFRDACIRRGIISSDTNMITLSTSNEQNYQENITNTVEESINQIPTTIGTNNEQIE